MVLVERGRLAWQSQDYTTAIDQFSLAIALNPQNNMAVGERGDAYRLQGDYPRALADFDHAIELNPKYAWAFAERGVTYRLQGDHRAHWPTSTRAIEFDPKYDWVFAQRGVTYRLRRIRARLGRFRPRPLRLIRSMPGLLLDTANLSSAGRLRARLADFDRAIELNPKYAWAFAQRGVTYRLQGDYAHALADFDRAIELDSKADWWLYERALTYRVGKHEEEAGYEIPRTR